MPMDAETLFLLLFPGFLCDGKPWKKQNKIFFTIDSKIVLCYNILVESSNQ